MESIEVLEEEAGKLRAAQARHEKVAFEKEREASSAVMSLEQAQRDYESSLKEYAKLEHLNASIKAKLNHIEREFETKKRDYHSKLNMLEDALLEEKKVQQRLLDDLRRDAETISNLRDEKRKNLWERDNAKSERREAENEAERLRVINEARVHASEDHVVSNQQRQMR